MIIADLEMEDKAGKFKFFQESFLVADTKFKAILGMLFLKMSNAGMSFNKKTFMWKFYITNKALPTTKQVQIVNLKEFVIAILDMGSKTFIVCMAIRKQEEMPVHSKKQAKVKALIFDKAPTEVPAEYSNYSNVFLVGNTAELLEHTKMSEHAIKLEEGKQPSFGPIYSLDLLMLEILKTYIKTNLTNGFI